MKKCSWKLKYDTRSLYMFLHSRPSNCLVAVVCHRNIAAVAELEVPTSHPHPTVQNQVHHLRRRTRLVAAIQFHLKRGTAAMAAVLASYGPDLVDSHGCRFRTAVAVAGQPQLSLEPERELEIQETGEADESGEHIDLRWAAVGQFLTDKVIKYEVMRQVLAAVWRPAFELHIKELVGNLYIFQFFHEKDICRILNEGHWAFENPTLVLKRVMEGDQSTKMKLDYCDFWVKIHDLPCSFMLECIAEQIGKSLGVFVKSDPNNFDSNWHSYLRIPVSMNVNSPLRNKMKIKKKGMEGAWIFFKYERLDTFCYFFGLLGHFAKFYRGALDSDLQITEYVFGSWMRASLRRTVAPIGERWLGSTEVSSTPISPMSAVEPDSTTHMQEDFDKVPNRATTSKTGMELDDNGLTVVDSKRRRGNGHDRKTSTNSILRGPTEATHTQLQI
nr:uncharacterized protein LOC109172169 [Ipomoea batatas]